MARPRASRCAALALLAAAACFVGPCFVSGPSGVPVARGGQALGTSSVQPPSAVAACTLAAGLRRSPRGRAHLLSRAGVAEDMNARIAGSKVLVVSKEFCPFCRRAKKALDDLGFKYEVLELEDRARRPLVDNGPEIQDYMETKTGGRSVPRIFIGGEFVGGCDDTLAKKRSGELAQLLEAAGAEKA
mmetsp:Transcript_23348/g.53408  ORF Transcript_23348/g.53408 Transcript_23348/m.53408 type:complete len:187 (+) Transcript_23348:58-618(+)